MLARDLMHSVKNSCPRATILEGYGITECSPVVSVMREDDVQPGTIGKPLPSVTAMVMDLDTRRPAQPGRTGHAAAARPEHFRRLLEL